MTDAISVLDGLRLSDWIEQSGISRSRAYELLKVLNIELESRRVPGSRKPVSFLSNEDLELLNPLAQQMASGLTLTEIKRRITVPNSPASSEMVVQNNPGPSELSIPQLEQIIEFLAPAAPAPDPLVLARRLKEASQLGVPLSNQEMNVLGRSEMKPSMHGGTEPRPGFRLERQKHDGKPFWTVPGSFRIVPSHPNGEEQRIHPNGRRTDGCSAADQRHPNGGAAWLFPLNDPGLSRTLSETVLDAVRHLSARCQTATSFLSNLRAGPSTS